MLLPTMLIEIAARYYTPCTSQLGLSSSLPFFFFLNTIKVLHEVPMISNSGQQKHLQVASGCAPSGRVVWTVSVPVSRYFRIFFCYLSIYLFELLVPDLLFSSHDPVFQR